MQRASIAWITLNLMAVLTLGCNQKTADQANRFKTMAADCKKDDDCAKGFICTEKKCTKGKRTKAELAARAKAKAEAKRKALAAKRAVKPGEGRMRVKICPFFKNTPEAVGQITAIHQTTKKKHYIHLALATPELSAQSEYFFYSLPLGKYDVTARYGIQKGGKHDLVDLKCDPKSKLACRDKKVREIDVVLPKDMPKPKPGKDGKPPRVPCDWIAE